MKSLATLFTSSKKKEKERDKVASSTASTKPALLAPPEPHYRRAASPAPSFRSNASTASRVLLRKHASSVASEAKRPTQDHPTTPVQRPALSRSFFRSTIDVSKVLSLTSPSQEAGLHERNSPALAPSDFGYLRHQTPPVGTTVFPSPTKSVKSTIVDEDDPFAAKYVPPTAKLQKRQSPPSVPPSPPRLLPELPKVNRPNAPRTRAVSLGSARAPSCPAHLLGPLPPLPQVPSLVQRGPHLADQSKVGVEAPHSAPIESSNFTPNRGRSGSTSMLANACVVPSKSPSPQSIGRVPPPRPPRPDAADDLSLILGPTPSPVTTSVSAPEVYGEPRAVVVNRSLSVRPGKVPVLDQTWANFLSETQGMGEISPLTTPTMEKGFDTSLRPNHGPPVVPPRSKARPKSKGPPPTRALPPPPGPLPEIPKTQVPLRARAVTLSTATATSLVRPRPPTLDFPITHAKARDGGNSPPLFTPPISPPPSAGPRLVFEHLNDLVVVTPPAEETTAKRLASVPETPETTSSLPYLLNHSPGRLTSPSGKHSRDGSASTADWDAASRSVSETSLSLFPVPPPTVSVSPLQIAGKEVGKSESRQTSLLPKPSPSTLGTIADLPTPPITPSHQTFASGDGLYSSFSASHSTSTIRPPPPESPEVAKRPQPTKQSSITSDCSTASDTAYTDDSPRQSYDTAESATTVSSQDSAVDPTLRASEEDANRPRTPPPTISITSAQKAHVTKASVWNESPQSSPTRKVASDKFGLLPNFSFDPTFGPPPSTPVKNRASVIVRHEQLIDLLGGGDTLNASRSPGSPFAGNGVEWGEAL